MLGMNRNSGEQLDGIAHIRQSITDILQTPIGSRIMLRNYGSEIPNLLDRPTNQLFDVELHATIARSLARWEPRFKVTKISVDSRDANGRVTISLDGVVVDSGNVVRLEGITI
jgi:phage baseplate assembly protein W